MDEFNRKPNKIWVDKDSEFYNRSTKSWVEKNAIEVYLIHSEGKSVVAGRFIKTLKNKIYKYKTSITKIVYIDKFDNIVNKYHRAIKIKPVNVKLSIYIDFNKENNKEGSRFKVDDNVKISKYKSIFAKGYIPNWFEVFVIKKVKNTVPWTYVINHHNGEEIVATSYKKELQKTNQKEFRVEKVIKRKDDKLYIKWKGYGSSVNS